LEVFRYNEAMEQEFRRLGAYLDQMLSKAEACARSEYEKLSQELPPKINELRDQSGQAWNDLKPGLEKAWLELRSSLETAASRFR
jgi:ElaB/YqjD/DUF883 family membrane-anchored ribosome-binding protein